MKLILKNEKNEIETKLGLDKGTLQRECKDYYRAEIDGDDRVGIYVEELKNNRILITEIHVGDDEMEVCGWCGKLYCKSEMREETHLGWICHNCESGIKSRGEQFIFKD